MTITFRQKRTLLRLAIKRADNLLTETERFMSTLSLGTCEVCKKTRQYANHLVYGLICDSTCKETAIQHLCFQLQELDSNTLNTLYKRMNQLQTGKQTLVAALENLETRYYARKEAKKIKTSAGGII